MATDKSKSKARSKLQKFFVFAETVFDIFTVFVASIDVISDILVAWEFYENGWMYPFLACLFVLLISNCVFVCVTVECDRIESFGGRLCLENYPKWARYLMLFPVAQLLPMISWVLSSFFATAEAKNKASLHRKITSDSECDSLALLAESVEVRLMTHRFFLIEALIEALPQSVIQLAAITYYNHTTSTIQVGSLLLSVISIVSKAYVYVSSFDTVVAATKFSILASDILSYFFAVATLFSLPPTTQWMGFPTTSWGYWWLSGISLFAVVVIGFRAANWAINLLEWVASTKDKQKTAWSHLKDGIVALCLTFLEEFAKITGCQVVKFSWIFFLLGDMEPSFEERYQHRKILSWLNANGAEEWVPKLKYMYQQLAHQLKQQNRSCTVHKWCDSLENTHFVKHQTRDWAWIYHMLMLDAPSKTEDEKKQGEKSHKIVPKQVSDFFDVDFIPLLTWCIIVIPYNVVHSIGLLFSYEFSQYQTLAKWLLVLHLVFFVIFVAGTYFAAFRYSLYVGTLKWTQHHAVRGPVLKNALTRQWVDRTIHQYYSCCLPAFDLLRCTFQGSGIPHDIVFCICEFLHQADVQTTLYFRMYCHNVLHFPHRLHNTWSYTAKKNLRKLMSHRKTVQWNGKNAKDGKNTKDEKTKAHHARRTTNESGPWSYFTGARKHKTYSDGASVQSLLRKARRKPAKSWYSW